MDVFLCTVVFCLLAFLFYKANVGILFNLGDPNSKLPLPPGSMGLPFFGNTFKISSEGFYGYFENQRKVHGSILKTYFDGLPAIMVHGGENLKKVYMGENKIVNMYWPPSIRGILGEHSILMQRGATHARLRQTFLKSFTPQRVDAYIPTIEKIARKYIRSWDRKRSAPILAGEEYFGLAFEVITTTMLGMENDDLDKTLVNAFNTMNKALSSMAINVPGTAYYKGMKARELFLTAIERETLRKMSERRDKNAPPKNALECFLDTPAVDGNILSMASLKDQLLITVFAGHSTTSAVLASFTAEVWRHPDLCEKLYQEQLEARPDPNEPFTMENLKEMPLLHMTMWESMRHQPPLAGQWREIIKTFELGGYQMPKGWFIFINQAGTLESAPAFTKPKQFEPDRFSAEKNEGQSADYGFKPFGAGKRSCIGEPLAWTEMQIFLSLFVRSYKWKANNYPVPWNIHNLLYCEDNLPITVERRADYDVPE